MGLYLPSQAERQSPTEVTAEKREIVARWRKNADRLKKAILTHRERGRQRDEEIGRHIDTTERRRVTRESKMVVLSKERGDGK